MFRPKSGQLNDKLDVQIEEKSKRIQELGLYFEWMKGTENEYKDYTNEIETAKSELEGIKTKKVTLQKQIKGLEEKQKQKDLLEEAIARLERRKDTCIDILAGIKAETKELDDTIDLLLTRIDSHDKHIERLKTEIESKKSDIERIESQRIDEMKRFDDIKEKIANIDEKRQECEHLEEQISRLSKKYAWFIEENRKKRQELKNIEIEKKKTVTETYEKVQKVKTALRITELEKRLQSKYS